jgi:PAS domain S-box-containing protein
MASSIPGPELTWRLHAECPAPCVLFQSVRDSAGALLDFQWTVLNPAAEALVRDLGLEHSLSSWASGVEGLPARTALRQVVEEGHPLSFELGCRPGGAERWFRAQAMKHGDGFSLWLFDITETHVTRRSLHEALEREQALRAREEHLRLALETAGMVTWDWLAARRSISWSSNVDVFFGQPPGGTGSSVTSFLGCVHPNDRKRVSEAIAQGLRAQGPYTFQFRGLWADGSVRCYEALGQTFHEGERPSRMLGVVLDCTEREQAQAALREAEERYRLATWATNDVLWDWSPVTDRIHWGEATHTMFGYTPEEMGDLDWWAQQVHPEDRHAVVMGLRQVVESEEEESWSAEYRFRRKDGTYAHVLDRGLVARDADGKVTRMIGSLMDITERKRTLDRMQEEAQFRERFIGILGHDLRNPLNAIALTARALRRRSVSPAQQQMAQRIEASAARMGNMISDILDLTRARLSGGIPLNVKSTRLPDLCQQVVEELSVAYPGRTITFETEGEGEGLWDPERLAQVVSNLVGNALEHGSPEGPIRVRCLDEPERQVLEVSNPGAPIPGHQVATLFDPFRQVSSRSGRRSGLGLGLFIVRELVEAHGGQVSVRSSEAEGTTFTVVLPREAGRSARSEPREQAHSA